MKTRTESDYIHSLIAEGEHQQQDFKFEISDARKIAKTLSAFANTDGGRLLIGVKDNGKIAGVQSAEEQYMIEAAAELYCEPTVSYHMQTYTVEGRCILMVHIDENPQKPVYAKEESGKKMAYLRILDENILATPVHLCMWQQSGNKEGEWMEFTEKEQNFLNRLDEEGTLTLNQCSKLTRMPRRHTIQLLAKLIRYGIVKTIFEGHQFRFTLKTDSPDEKPMQPI